MAREDLEAPAQEQAPQPQPERREPKLEDPDLGDLSKSDYVAIAKRAGKEVVDDNIPLIAQALAYSAFLAIPSVLLVVVGAFTLLASPDDIASLVDRVGNVVPSQTTELLNDSLQRLEQKPSTGVAMTIVGLVLAIWSTTGAMNALMVGLNIAYERKETRSFVRRRLIGLAMVGCLLVAFLLIFGLLVLGPQLSKWIGGALGIESAIGWLWWVAQWPLLLVGLLAMFATVLYLGPNVEHPKWHFVTPGSLTAVFLWLAASGLFAVYTSMFGSYNKTWGSLAAVIVMLTWLWLTSLSILFGAEINAEVERSRELRRGEPAERELQASARQ